MVISYINISGATMIIKNECGCIVDSEQLTEAIAWYKQKIKTKRFSATAKIFLSNGYPVVSIKGKNTPVTKILLSYEQNHITNSKVYHVDANPLNCLIENLTTEPQKTMPVISYNYKQEKIGEYPSIAEASRQTGISEQIIHLQLHGKTTKKIKIKCPEGYNGSVKHRYRNIRYPILFQKKYIKNHTVGACPKGHHIFETIGKLYYCSECHEKYQLNTLTRPLS